MKNDSLPIKNGEIDIDALPEGMTLKQLLKKAREQGIPLEISITPSH